MTYTCILTKTIKRSRVELQREVQVVFGHIHVAKVLELLFFFFRMCLNMETAGDFSDFAKN